MAAVRRPDGLYDLPELGYSGVPGGMLPDNLRMQADDLYNQAAAAPPPEPDLRLAANEGGNSARGPTILGEGQPSRASYATAASGGAGGGEGGRSAMSNSVGSDTQSSMQLTPIPPLRGTYEDPSRFYTNQSDNPIQNTVPKEQLNAPPTSPAPARSMADEYWNQYLMKQSRGTPARTIPGGPQLTQEVWQQRNVVPMPGVTPVIVEDPRTGLPVRKMVPNDVLFGAEESKERQTEEELVAQKQEQMQSQASREVDMGNVLMDSAQRERLDIEREQQFLEQQRAQVAKRDAEVTNILGNLGGVSREYPAGGETKSRFLLGIAQGLLYAGAAAAGQQVPNVNFLRDAIEEDARREQMELQRQQLAFSNGIQLAHLKLSGLHALQQQFQDPTAALHALRAARWVQAQHELEAMTRRSGAYQLSEQADALMKQLELERIREAKAAYAAEHQKTIENLPPKTIGGSPGGLPAVIAAIKKQMVGAPKETVDQAINDAVAAMQKGQPFTFPSGPGKKPERAEVEFAKDIRARTWTPPAFMGGQRLYTAREEDAKKYQALSGDTEELISHVQKIKDLVARAGSSLPGTDTRRAIETEQAWLMNASRRLANTGVPQEMELEKIIKPMAAMDVNELIKIPDRDKMLDNVIGAAQRSVISQTAKGSYADPELAKPFDPNAGVRNPE